MFVDHWTQLDSSSGVYDFVAKLCVAIHGIQVYIVIHNQINTHNSNKYLLTITMILIHFFTIIKLLINFFYRDASYTNEVLYGLTVEDCVNALFKAKWFGFFNFDDFDLDEYEKYEVRSKVRVLTLLLLKMYSITGDQRRRLQLDSTRYNVSIIVSTCSGTRWQM